MLVQDKVLNAEEVADILRVDERTVKRLASRGDIVGFRIGGRWRFRREAVDEYIKRQEQQSERDSEV